MVSSSGSGGGSGRRGRFIGCVTSIPVGSSGWVGSSSIDSGVGSVVGISGAGGGGSTGEGGGSIGGGGGSIGGGGGSTGAIGGCAVGGGGGGCVVACVPAAGGLGDLGGNVTSVLGVRAMGVPSSPTWCSNVISCLLNS
jgi:hypothetical protein